MNISLIFSKFGRSDKYLGNCTATLKKDVYEKPYLRAAALIETCDESNTMPIESYFAKKANEYMTQLNDSEAPQVPKRTVLYTAKSRHESSKYIHDDPLQSLLIIKNNRYYNEIKSIGLGPVFVRCRTNAQLNMYTKICTKEKAHIRILKTASIVPRINSKTIMFFHIASIGGQFTIMHIFSEEFHFQASIEWLACWRYSGAIEPSTCTTNRSRALQNAIVKVFTHFKYIEQCADALKKRCAKKRDKDTS